MPHTESCRERIEAAIHKFDPDRYNRALSRMVEQGMKKDEEKKGQLATDSERRGDNS